MNAKTIAKIQTALLFCLVSIAVYGQQASIKTAPSGNGPFLDAVTIKNVKIGESPAPEPLGTMLKGNNELYYRSKVSIDFRIYGNITQYRYKGVSYKDKSLPNLLIKKQMMVKATVKINTGNTVLTETKMVGMSSTPPSSVLFHLDKPTKAKAVSIVSIKIEPVDLFSVNNHIEWCLKQQKEADKRKEVNAKAAEENKKKPQIKSDDDFWKGGKSPSQKKSTSAIVASGDDFWKGGQEKVAQKTQTKTKSEKTTDSGFWEGNESKEANNKQNDFWSSSRSDTPSNKTNFSIKRDGGFNWVADENGKLLIPKVPYTILSYKKGLANASKKIRSEESSLLGGAIIEYETFYLDETGTIIPPKDKSVEIPGKWGGLTTRPYFTDYEEEQAYKERVNQKKEQQRQERNRLKAYYEARGYDVTIYTRGFGR